ncbi:hypothetical protein PG985_007510 [Apiospora marii]|uniref:Uncharacterized protein n=1 Tax=Apiospora marii TaxID=335849 RepID=A0ABR1SNC8_9PEZI
MSGGPGGGMPECTGGESPYLWHPQEGSTCQAGNETTLVWSGGYTGEDRNTRALWSAYLVKSKAAYLENTTVFDSNWFQYGNPDWTPADQCKHTQIEYNWTIPANLTSEVAQYRYLFVMVSSYVRGAASTPSRTELPSTSTGAWFIVMPTTTSFANATAASTPPTSPSTYPTTDPTAETEPELIPGGLSTGGKAGIGVGVSLGVISFLVAVIFLWFRRGARGREFRGRVAEESQERYDKAELDSGGQEKNNNQQQTPEADGRPLSELTARPVEKMPPPQDPIELPTELPGSGRDP